MSKMFLMGSNQGSNRARVVSRAPAQAPAPMAPVVPLAPRSLPAPLVRMRGRTPMISLGSIMTHNSTPCRSCGH
jgi:hypothetical protein